MSKYRRGIDIKVHGIRKCSLDKKAERCCGNLLHVPRIIKPEIRAKVSKDGVYGFYIRTLIWTAYWPLFGDIRNGLLGSIPVYGLNEARRWPV